MKVFVAGLLVVLLGHALAATALYSPTEDATLSAGRVCAPGTFKGRLDNANYEIIIPSNWNQVLILYVHGYSYTIPAAKAFFSNPYWPSNATSAQEILLQEGYALAGSSFSAGGWAVAEALADTDRLTREISSGFGCVPRWTILFGVSLGSLTVLTKAEQDQTRILPLYDGVISGCSIGAGASKTVDLSLQFNLGFDSAFYDNGVGGWPEIWGTPQFVNPKIDYSSQVEPHMADLLRNQANFGRFEFQRLVSVLSEEGYYPWSPPPSDVSLFTDSFFSTQALAELQTRAGGKVNGNIGKRYSLSDSNKAYLAQLGVNADSLLEYMNSRTQFVPDPQGAAYVKKYADFTGHLKIPVITMHTRNDGLIPATSDTVYRETVGKAGRLELLQQVYTTASGHCNFTPQQVVLAIRAMDNWLKGQRPRPVDFPVSAGFQPPDYTPGPWPY